MRPLPDLLHLPEGVTLKILIDRLTTAWAQLRDYLRAIPMPDIDNSGRKLAGGLDAEPVDVTFSRSGADVFVPHSLGRPVTQAIVSDLRAYSDTSGKSRVAGQVTILSSQRAPQKDGLWMTAVFSEPVATVKARLLVFGR